MPIVACPDCGSHTRVSSENLGRSIECSKCTKRFAATAEAKSWKRILDRKHPAGYRFGQLLLLLTVALGVTVTVAVKNQRSDLYGALFGRESLSWARGLFLAGFGSLLAGCYLIHRYWRAMSRWPRR